jgi:hypothetical protein
MESWIEKAIEEHRKWQPGSGLENQWHANQHRVWVIRHGMYFSDATFLLTDSDNRGSLHSSTKPHRVESLAFTESRTYSAA